MIGTLEMRKNHFQTQPWNEKCAWTLSFLWRSVHVMLESRAPRSQEHQQYQGRWQFPSKHAQDRHWAKVICKGLRTSRKKTFEPEFSGAGKRTWIFITRFSRMPIIQIANSTWAFFSPIHRCEPMFLWPHPVGPHGDTRKGRHSIYISLSNKRS